MLGKIIYEDEELELLSAPNDEEAKELIINIFREKNRPMTFQELREIFSATIGEDKLRRLLIRLREEGYLVLVRSKYYPVWLPETEKVLEEVKRRRIMREAMSLFYGRRRF